MNNLNPFDALALSHSLDVFDIYRKEIIYYIRTFTFSPH